MGDQPQTAGSDPVKVIDWEQIRRRLEHIQLETRQAFTPTETECRRILRRRAEALAREPVREDLESRFIDAVGFVLAYEHYAVESAFVREILPLRNFTPLPGTPPFVFGIMNVRGQIVTIIDIKRFFDLPDKGLADLNKVIVLEGDNIEFGILADSIIGVLSLNENDLIPPLHTLTGIREKYLKGLTPDGMILLSARAILTDDTILIDEQVKPSLMSRDPESD